MVFIEIMVGSRPAKLQLPVCSRGCGQDDTTTFGFMVDSYTDSFFNVAKTRRLQHSYICSNAHTAGPSLITIPHATAWQAETYQPPRRAPSFAAHAKKKTEVPL